MKNLFLLFAIIFFFGNCSDSSSSSTSAPDTEYNLDGIRILFPKTYQKISSEAEIRKTLFEGKDSLSFLNQFLLEKFLALGKNQNHWFAKLENEKLGFITLKTDGPILSLNNENTEYLLQQHEALLERNFKKPNSNYRFRKLEEKLTGAHRVKYFKFQYAHFHDDTEWFTTNYLIYANSRTIALSIISLEKNHLDLENYMQFIEIK